MIGMKKDIGVTAALQNLTPNAQWIVRNENYEEIEWFSEDIQKPTFEQVKDKIKELKKNEGITAVREIRDWYLQQSDWTQGQDIRLLKGEDWCQAWDTYRQQLRDLPSSGMNPYFDENNLLCGVEWPQKPNA
jgi:hypothetical protein